MKNNRYNAIKCCFCPVIYLYLLILFIGTAEIFALSMTKGSLSSNSNLGGSQNTTIPEALSIASIKGISLDQPISPGVTVYTADVESDILSLDIELADPESTVDFSAELPAVLLYKIHNTAYFKLKENALDNRILITVSNSGLSNSITYIITVYRPLDKNFEDSKGPQLIAEYKEGKIHHHWKFWDKTYDLPNGKKVRLRWQSYNCKLVSNISGDGGKTWTPDFIEIDNFRPDFNDYIEIFQISDGSFIAYQYASMSHLVYKKEFGRDEKFKKVHDFVHYSTTLHEVELPNGSSRLFIPRYNDGTEGKDSFSISDDLGYTWHEVKLPIPPEEAGFLVEPNFIDKLDGTLWVTYRSQVGLAIYEMFSYDYGLTWTPLRESHFISGTTWQKSYRVPAGKYKESLVYIWANMRKSAPEDKVFYNPGREALHVAISQDDGKTWQGFRQVNVYHLRYGDQPIRRDRGCTDQVIEYRDGKYYIYSGNGNHYYTADRRHLSNPYFMQREIEIDFDWLKQNFAKDDFSAPGIDNDFENGELSQWLLIKRVGDIFSPTGHDRMRVPGPQLLDLGDKKILQIRRRLNEYNGIIEPPDVATWNFPNGTKGVFTTFIKLSDTFQGACIRLNDQLYYNSDGYYSETSIMTPQFSLPINREGYIVGKNITQYDALSSDRWHKLQFAWDLDKRKSDIYLDGQFSGYIHLENETPNGLSYVRFESTAGRNTEDTDGFYIRSVNVRVQNPVNE